MGSSYAKACCEVLSRQKEYPTDESIVSLVGGQLLSHYIIMKLDLRSSMPSPPPLKDDIDDLARQIEKFRADLPVSLRENRK
jgi:hypothetical protein